MELTDIRELYACPDKYIGQEITVGGWIRSLRDSKAFGFIVLNDGTYFQPSVPDKASGSRVKAHIRHNRKRKSATDREYKIQREKLSQKSVYYTGQRSAANARRSEYSEYGASVLLGQRQHHRRVKYWLDKTKPYMEAAQIALEDSLCHDPDCCDEIFLEMFMPP